MELVKAIRLRYGKDTVTLVEGDKIIVERLPIYAASAANAMHRETTKKITFPGSIIDTCNHHLVKLDGKYMRVHEGGTYGIEFKTPKLRYAFVCKA